MILYSYFYIFSIFLNFYNRYLCPTLIYEKQNMYNNLLIFLSVFLDTTIIFNQYKTGDIRNVYYTHASSHVV